MTPAQKLVSLRTEFQKLRPTVAEAQMFLIALEMPSGLIDTLLSEADDAADPDTVAGYEEGLKKLKTYKAVLKKIKSQNKKTVSEDKKQKVYKARYILKKERLLDGIKELEQMPGTRKDVADLRNQIKEADALA